MPLRPVASRLVALRTVVLSVGLAATLLLTGCSGSDDAPAKTADGTLAPRLLKAKTALDGAETLTIDLSTTNLPAGVTGLLSAAGQGNHSPAFKGTVKVAVGGASLGADVVAVDGTVYAKTGFAPSFLTIDPASLKAPDPAALVARSGGISDLLIKTTHLADAGRTRDGATVLAGIKGTLPGRAVQSLVPSADATKDFRVTYRLTGDGALHDATIVGPFYPDADDITYTVTVTTSDTPVTIRKP